MIERPTGRTVGDVWASLDDQQKRRYLLAGGIRVHVSSSAELRNKPGGWRLDPAVPLIAVSQLETSREIDSGEIIYVEGNPARLQGALRHVFEPD